MQWTKTPATQRGAAFVIDNRDGSIERIGQHRQTIAAANETAFALAALLCKQRNAGEGWQRFVALTQQAADAAGIVARFYAGLARSAG